MPTTFSTSKTIKHLAVFLSDTSKKKNQNKHATFLVDGSTLKKVDTTTDLYISKQVNKETKHVFQVLIKNFILTFQLKSKQKSFKMKKKKNLF